MQVRADDLEQILDRSVVGEAVSQMVEFFPIDGVLIEMIENGAIGNFFVEPGEVSGDAEIAPGAANNRGVIRRIPRAHGFSRHIIGGMMFVHSAFQPDLDEIAQRNRIEQRQRQRGERGIPRETESWEHMPAQRQISRAVGRIGGKAASKQQIGKTIVVELPERFIVCDQPREIAAEI